MNIFIKKTLTITAVIALALPLTNCARRIGSNQFSAASVGESVRTYEGVVVSKRIVEVNEAERFGDNTSGGAIGGLAGGLLGNQLGRGKGRIAATGIGAAAGIAGGMLAQDHLGRQQAYEYVIRIAVQGVRAELDGALRTVVQGLDVDLKVGQQVLLQESNQKGGGRSRVVPISG